MGIMKVSLVIPTRNEEKNIIPLLDRIASSMEGIDHEVLVVDDSDNNMTISLAIMNGARVIIGQHKGLGQAIIDGINESQGDIIVVSDADLSHKPEDIPRLINAIVNDGYDMSIGSRYCEGGGTIGWELTRRIISRCACLLALPITSIKDATSGFFSFRKSLINKVKLEPSSWKIMLEVLLKAKPTRVIEIPIVFEVRKEGKSKFNRKQMIAYLKHLVLLALFRYQKLLKFGIAEGLGTIIVFGLVWLLTELSGMWYMFSLALATIVGFFFKYVANTIWTFKVVEEPSSADYEWRSFYRGSLIQKWWKQSIAKIVWDWMPNSSKLLDIGCGSSPIITHYAGDVIGIDINEAKLEYMKQKCPRHRFINWGIDEFNDSEFDHILCIEVLEHLQNPEEMIKGIARVMIKNGKVIIATPDYSKWLWTLAERFTPYKEEHIRQFTRDSLEVLCLKYGLKPVKYHYIATCDLVEMFEKAG